MHQKQLMLNLDLLLIQKNKTKVFVFALFLIVIFFGMNSCTKDNTDSLCNDLYTEWSSTQLLLLSSPSEANCIANKAALKAFYEGCPNHPSYTTRLQEIYEKTDCSKY